MYKSRNLNNFTTIYDEFKICLSNFRFIKYPTQWEQNILNLVPKKYRKKYCSLAEEILNEVKNMYINDMQNFINEYVLLNLNTNTSFSCGLNNLNCNLLTKQEDNISLKCRKLMYKKYFHHLYPIKVIINEAYVILPTIICNFEYYHSLGLLSLAEFKNILLNDIKVASVAIRNKYYSSVTKRIQESRILRDINMKKLIKVMKCVTHIFVQQILNVMIRSIDYILNILSDGYHCPQIKFELLLKDNKLLLSPSMEEVYTLYTNLIEKINTIAENLLPLEEWINIKSHLKHIKIRLPDWYIKDSHSKLKVILEALFDPVHKDVAHITSEFYPICIPNFGERISLSTSKTIDFDLYLKNIQYHRTFLTKTNTVVLNTYHIIGKVEQRKAIEDLRKECSNIITMCINKLIEYHQEINLSICTNYEDLKRKALNVPKDPNSLIELCDYISHYSHELRNKLEDKIKKSVYMIIALSDVTIMSESHIQLNIKTINWLYEIEPILKKSNILSEAMKNELEDDIQNRINDLNAEVENIVPQLRVLDNMDDINNIEEYLQYYKIFLKQANHINHEMKRINNEENMFKFPETEFPNVIDLYKLIMSFHDLLSIVYQWQRDHSVWLDGPFEWLNAATIETKTLNYFEQITKMSRDFRAKIKMDAGASKCFKFTGIADDPDPLQQPAPLKLCWQALNEINNFKKYLSLVSCFCNPALQKRHWTEMSTICNFDLKPNAGTSLRKIIAFNLMDDIEKYKAIAMSATRELELEQKLLKMNEEWDKISFEINLDETTGNNTFLNLNKIELLLEEQLVEVEEMKTSNFVKQIFPRLISFHSSLIRIKEIVNQWHYVQTLLHSSHFIFRYPNIELVLPEEFTLFEAIEKILQDMKNKLLIVPTFAEIDNIKILNSLNDAVAKLEHINKQLTNYIEAKMMSFPRFHFLSTKEIKEILFQSYISDKPYIFVQKCFQGILDVKINKEKCIYSIVGDYREEVKLNKFITFHLKNKREEEWLINLEKEINDTVRQNILQCYEVLSNTCSYNNVINFPSMAIVSAFQLRFTADVDKCFTPFNFQALDALNTIYIKHLNSLVTDMRRCTTQKRKSLLSTLIVIVNHQKDIIRLLVDKNVTKTTDFEWVAQLQYYLENDEIKILIFHAGVNYGYEYGYYKQGIINTTLSERCYHTLMQAYKYHLYGAVAGPTATGKTETIESLAKTIAIQFHIFDCSTIFSYKFLSQLFKGFLTCHAWLCFENLHKLQIDFIGKLTQSLISVSQAIATNLKFTVFEGCSLKVNPSGHISIVTELGLYKYSKLPDNFKRLFRTVCMLMPDMKNIVEIELFVAGIHNPKLLSSKLITFYKILSQQLLCHSCKQFNLYTIKIIIKTIISLRNSYPEENETVLLLRSLIDVTIPKLCKFDIHVFRNIVKDMFPNVSLISPDYSNFVQVLEKVCKSRDICIHDTLKLKIIQMFELTYVYHSLFLVGDPFVGKTEILNILQAVLLDLQEQNIEYGANVKLEIMALGSISMNQFFGYFDEKSNTWKHGICSKLFSSVSEKNSFNRKWVIFEGSLNHIWIENLYKLLGSNSWVQLASGEKINIPSSISIIFELMNLANVSPAMISHSAVIYIESNSIDWRPYVKTHIIRNNIYKCHKDTLELLLNWTIQPCLQFVRNHCTVISNIGHLHYIKTVLNLLEIYLEDSITENVEEKGKTNHFLVWIQVALILAVTWGIGGNLNADSHVKFNTFCLNLWTDKNVDSPKPDVIKSIDISLPNDGLIQDNFYVFKGVGYWKYWGSIDIIKSEQICEISNCNEVFVPTLNTMKYNHIISNHAKHKKPFILSGNTSTGKTFLLKNFVKNKMLDGRCLSWLSFTSKNTVFMLQKLLLSKLKKIRRGHYSPLNSQFSVNFIDDLNVQKQEHLAGINTVLELLRQYYNYGYFHDCNTSEKVFLYDVIFSLSIAGNTISDLCPRLLRNFHVYAIYQPTTDVMCRIFSNVLFHNLKANSFAPDVLSTATSITNATIDIYISVLKTLKPVPSKFQYHFNIRDIARVIDGCSLLQKESVETKVTFIRLWAHEIWRVFGDRISDYKDKQWLFLQIREICKRHFKDSFETAFDYLPKNDNNEITVNSFYNLMFSNFLNVQNGINKRYDDVNSIDKLKNKILSYLTEYNNNNNSKECIDIVLTHFILSCLIRLSRILAIPGGNALIISAVNSGRKSLTKLSAYMQQQELFEPSVYSYHDFDRWRRDFKNVLQKCGAFGQTIVLFLKDKRERDNFFNDIISFLTVGEVSDLFSAEEKCKIIETVRLHAQGCQKNAEINNQNVINYFQEQCRNKLHVVICLDSTNRGIRSYLHKYPELVKYCTINWFETWPADTLSEVGLKYISHMNIKEEVTKNIIKACTMLYDNVKEESEEYYRRTWEKVHITQSGYLHMLKLYTHLISSKQKDIVSMKNRYSLGLEKLESTAQQVKEMNYTLTILKSQLQSSAIKTEDTLNAIEVENISLEKTTKLVQQEEEVANKKADIAGKLRAECEADLAVAIPILEDAIAALNTLKPADITLVKAMKNPPDTVKLVMAAICVMLDIPADKTIDSVTGKKHTDYWSPSKRVLSDMNFLQTLKDYDKDNIPNNTIQVIKSVYMMDNNFKPHIVAKASSAAEGLCKWVRAMVSYDEVANAVAPKKKKLFVAQEECNEAEAFLNNKRKALSALNAKLATLNNSLQETIQEKIKLENEVQICANKLHKAEKLMSDLESERNLWKQHVEILTKKYDNLLGDMILSSATISYLAPYSIMYRNQIVERWKQSIKDIEIPYSEDYNLINVLETENEMNNLYYSNFSKNSFTIENTLIMRNSMLWPLFIDSQNLANEWIKTIERENKLRPIKVTDSDYIAIIQHNVINGIPTLIENVNEELSILLHPFLDKNIYHHEGHSYLDTGRDLIKYSPSFRLYITTRLSRPQFPYEIFNKLTIINFSIATEDLQDRLLDIIVSKERPDLQEKFKELLVLDACNKKKLKEQDSIVLNILSSSTAIIIENECTIRDLNASKNLSFDIIEKQKLNLVIWTEISQFRNAYLQLAQYCAIFFNDLINLSQLSHMYRFSLLWYLQLYQRSVEKSNRSNIILKRLKFLKSSFTQNLYSSICRSLSEKHKLLYSFLLCSKILLYEQQTTEEEISYFISPNIHNNEIPNNIVNWLPYNIWANIYNLSKTIPVFFYLPEHICHNNKIWEKYYNSEQIGDYIIPEPWDNKLSLFQKLMLVKILHPEKVVAEIKLMMKEILGDTENYSQQLKISESYLESNCLTPLLFILPASVEPLSLISSYAKVKGHFTKFMSLSMSVGQENKAEALMQTAQKNGSWIFIQNCHLVPHWMIQLEKMYENYNTSNVSLNFRLWLSSRAMKEFPINVLENSVKIVHDYALNIRETLLNIYQSEPIAKKDFFEGCPGKEKIFSKLLFGICLFHAAITERQSFGIHGWNLPYQFDYSDLQMSITQLQYFINDTHDVPFNIFQYLIAECNYAGRMINKFDSKCIKTLFNDYCNSKILTCFKENCSNKIEELIPQRYEYHYVIEHLEKMPLSLSYQLLPYNRNCLINKDTAIATKFLSSLSYMTLVTPATEKEFHKDEILVLINDIKDKLHNSIETKQIQENCNSMLEDPLQRLRLSEMISLKHILNTVLKTLDNLKLALSGNIPLSDYLNQIAQDLYKHKVPNSWTSIHDYYISSNLSHYISNLSKRINFFENWLTEHPKSFPFDALFHCRMFLPTISLMSSRKYNVPVEDTIFHFEVITTNTSDRNLNDSYIITGLNLCGARWDIERNALTENYTNETWQEMPPIRVTYSKHENHMNDIYDCPIYMSANQQVDENIEYSLRNYIFSIPLNCNKSPTHWIKRGTRLFCHIP